MRDKPITATELLATTPEYAPSPEFIAASEAAEEELFGPMLARMRVILESTGASE